MNFLSRTVQRTGLRSCRGTMTLEGNIQGDRLGAAHPSGETSGAPAMPRKGRFKGMWRVCHSPDGSLGEVSLRSGLAQRTTGGVRACLRSSFFNLNEPLPPFYLMAPSGGPWDLSSLTRDQTHAPHSMTQKIRSTKLPQGCGRAQRPESGALPPLFDLDYFMVSTS